MNPSAASESDLDQTEQRQIAKGIEVLLCDVFGTVVDWRGSLIRQLEGLSHRRGWEIDAPHFADEWRSQYGPSMDEVLTGTVPWTSLDDLHRAFIQQIFETHAGEAIELQVAVQMAMVARFYERPGDHAVNIAHRVRYISSGWLPGQNGTSRHHVQHVEPVAPGDEAEGG